MAKKSYKIAFVDLEFGRIYGGKYYGNSNLISEIAVFIYEKHSGRYYLAEKSFKLITPLIFFKRNNTEKKERYSYLQYENGKIEYNYDENYRISREKFKNIIKTWDLKYANKVIYFLNSIFDDKRIREVCFFAAKEDLKMLSKYKNKRKGFSITLLNRLAVADIKFVDLADFFREKNGNYRSLDVLDEKYRISKKVPKILKKIENYENHFFDESKLQNWHSAVNDVIRSFLLYKIAMEKLNDVRVVY
jgi:hypothetical protein